MPIRDRGLVVLLPLLWCPLIGAGTVDDWNAALHNRDWAAGHDLIARGFDVNARNEHGATALHYAAAQGDPEMVRSLLHKGADARDVEGRTPLTMATELGKGEVVRILSKR